jgi:hypothetical protein
MNKYLNILIVSFFTVLTSQYNFSFTLYIPIVCFLVFNNNKNMLLIVPASLLAMFWFNNKLLLELGIVLGLIIVFMLITRGEKNPI